MVKNFYTPKQIDEALELRKNDRHSLFLAGGTLLNSGRKRAEINLISLQMLDLCWIKKEQDHISIGSMTTLQQILESTVIKEAGLIEFQDSCRSITRNIRNASTIGGVLGSNYSRSDIIPLLIVMDATVVVKETQKNDIAIQDFINKRAEGYSSLIISVKIPIPAKQQKIISKRFTRSSLDLPVVKVAARIESDRNIIKQAIIAVGGAGDTSTELKEIGKYLQNADLNNISSSQKKEISNLLDHNLNARDDIRGSGDYKKQLIKTMIEDILTECKKREGIN